MILKTLTRKAKGSHSANIGQIVKYICRYILDKEKTINPASFRRNAPEHAPVIIRHNLRSRSIDGFIREFAANEANRLVNRKNKVVIEHNILSLGVGDRAHITNKMLRDLGQKFISLRGEHNLYLGTAHFNRDAIHLHVLVSGVQLSGRSSRISIARHQSIKNQLERYQREQYPFLVHSRVEHEKKSRSRESIVKSVIAERQTNKTSIRETLEKAAAKATSKDDFLTELQALGLEPYYRGEKLQGILYEGKTKYRFSRLGFDESQLEMLGANEQKEPEVQALEELQSLREGNTRELEQVPSTDLVDMEQASVQEQEALNELSAIRSGEYQSERDLIEGEQERLISREQESRLIVKKDRMLDVEGMDGRE